MSMLEMQMAAMFSLVGPLLQGPRVLWGLFWYSPRIPRGNSTRNKSKVNAPVSAS